MCSPPLRRTPRPVETRLLLGSAALAGRAPSLLAGEGWERGKPYRSEQAAYPSPARGEVAIEFVRVESLRSLHRSAPPASARTPPASCRHPWARSAAPNAPRVLSPAAQADARAATSRVRRTSRETGAARDRPFPTAGRKRDRASTRPRGRRFRRLRRGRDGNGSRWQGGCSPPPPPTRPSLRGAKRRSNPERRATHWIASLRSQ